MNRKEAMEMAVKIVDEQAKPVMKSNGYAPDGWRAPSLEEKVDAIVKLSEFLWDSDSASIDPVQTVGIDVPVTAYDA